MTETVAKPSTAGATVLVANKQARLLAVNTKQAPAGTIGVGTVKTVQTKDGRGQVAHDALREKMKRQWTLSYQNQLT